MTNAQKLSLETLLAAFRAASEIGAMDVLDKFLSAPASINDVVEALEEALDHDEVQQTEPEPLASG